MTGEVRRGIGVLGLVVVAVIAWLALGPSPARHDGLTQVAAERFAARGMAPRCIRRVRCRAVAGHWDCAVVFIDGSVIRRGTDPAGPATAFVVSC